MSAEPLTPGTAVERAAAVDPPVVVLVEEADQIFRAAQGRYSTELLRLLLQPRRP